MTVNYLATITIVLVCIVLLTNCTNSTTTTDLQSSEKNIISDDEITIDLTKTYKFDLDKSTFELKLSFSERLEQYFEAEPKTFKYQGYAPPSNWEQTYYDMFLENPNDEKILQQIIEELKSKEGNLVELLIAFIQGGLTYDWDSYYSINADLKYPYETLYHGKGVCSDKTLILGKLLIKLDYDICFFAFPKANHIAIGLKVPTGYGDFGTDYAFIETTNYKRIGTIPKTYESGVELEPNPTVYFPSSRGKKVYTEIITYKQEEADKKQKYGENYWVASAEQKYILEDLYQLKLAQKAKKRALDKADCKGMVSQDKAAKCQKLTDEFNAIVKRYNKAVDKYNSLNEKEL